LQNLEYISPAVQQIQDDDNPFLLNPLDYQIFFIINDKEKTSGMSSKDITDDYTFPKDSMPEFQFNSQDCLQNTFYYIPYSLLNLLPIQGILCTLEQE